MNTMGHLYWVKPLGLRNRLSIDFLATLLVALFVLHLLAGCTTYSVMHEPYHIAERAHSGGNALAIDPNSNIGASGGWSGKVRLWRLDDGVQLTGWRTGHGDLFGLFFLDSSRLLTAGYDGYVRIWRLDGALDRSFKAGAAITSFRATPDRSFILLGHEDGTVSLWHIDGEQVGSWQLSNKRVAAVAVADDLNRLAAADTAANVWRWEPSGLPTRIDSPPTYPRSLIFQPGTKKLLGSGWFNIFAWNNDGTALTVSPTDHRGIINHLELSPDGAYLASISRINDSAVLLVNPSNGVTLRAFRKHDLCGQRVALSPDGRIMMSNADDASVRFYKLPEMGAELSTAVTGLP